MHNDIDLIIPYYDDLNRMLIYVNSLRGFNWLCQERYEAGYDRQETLHNYIVRGRWFLDSSGNISRVSYYDEQCNTVDIDCDNLPLIIPWPSEILTNLGVHSVATRNGRCLPSSYIHCPVCNEGWTIINAHDSYVDSKCQAFKGEEVFRKTFAQIEREKTSTSPLFRDYQFNDAFILNAEGNRIYPDLDEYIFQSGDHLDVTYLEWMHKECLINKQAQEYREVYAKVISEAGFDSYEMKAIKNEYRLDGDAPPWFIVNTPKVSFKIGFRKHVTEIELLTAFNTPLNELFVDENVTKSPTFIHAYNLIDVCNYLRVIRLDYEKVTT
jgi:hypothetical protein